MKFRTFLRGIGEGFTNLVRNARMSIASIATISICLVLLGMTFVLLYNVRSFTTQLDDNVCVVVFPEADLPEEQFRLLSHLLENAPQTAEFVYISPEEAWADFKAQLAAEGELDPELADYVNGNPLEHSDNFRLTLTSAAAQASLLEYLNTLPGIRKINYSSAITDVLTNLVRIVTVVGVIMIAVLVFVSIILITNTVRTSVFMRGEEISIMKYLGASDGYIELPFMVQGVLIGLLGSVLPCLLICFGYSYVIDLAAKNFSAVTDLVSFVPLEEMTPFLFPAYAILSIVVGTVGSLLAMKRYLRA